MSNTIFCPYCIAQWPAIDGESVDTIRAKKYRCPKCFKMLKGNDIGIGIGLKCVEQPEQKLCGANVICNACMHTWQVREKSVSAIDATAYICPRCHTKIPGGEIGIDLNSLLPFHESATNKVNTPMKMKAGDWISDSTVPMNLRTKEELEKIIKDFQCGHQGFLYMPNKTTIDKHSGSKYMRQIRSCLPTQDATLTVDVYCVIKAFGITCPAQQHALKKILCPGDRGKGSVVKDLTECIDALHRAIELAQQDVQQPHTPNAVQAELKDMEAKRKWFELCGVTPRAKSGWNDATANQLEAEMQRSVQKTVDLMNSACRATVDIAENKKVEHRWVVIAQPAPTQFGEQHKEYKVVWSDPTDLPKSIATETFFNYNDERMALAAAIQECERRNNEENVAGV